MTHFIWFPFLVLVSVLSAQSSVLASDMVLVPAGEFTMGTAAGSDGLPDEQPQRKVLLGAFWIDR